MRGKNTKLLLSCTAFLFLCMLACVVGVASARTIYVPDDYAKIQWAVDSASDGDTIIVRDGTYYENVLVNKMLTIRSENGSANCIVDGGGGGTVITLNADGIKIEGFTVRNSGSLLYAGIKVFSNANKIAYNSITNNYNGIHLYYSSNNTIAKNNVSSNNEVGILLWYSSSNTIANNNISSNNCYGIYLSSSSNNTIASNTVSSNNDDGICLYNSSSNTIANNNISSNNCYGIYLSPSSNNNIIANNTVSSNNWDGICLSSSSNIITNNTVSSNNDDGICLYNSSNTIANNTVSNNSCGIFLDYSSNNTIANNTISNNYYGIFLDYSSNNKIYLNNFIDNTGQVCSSRSTNIWNSTEKITYTYNGKQYTNYLGNYWSDYVGSDADGDGIGDTPYGIDGDKDYYPLMEPGENYFLTTPTPTPTPIPTPTPAPTPTPTIIYVPDDYARIQWAVDNASAGDTIIVRDGNYYENVVVDKKLTIKSENGSAYCIVNGGGSWGEKVFSLEADGIRIEGFTITGGWYGIYICSNENSISNNNISSNNCYGMCLEDSDNNSISNNNISNNECGIHFYRSNRNTISNNIISLNEVYGIWLEDSNNNNISENNISNNDYGIELWYSKNNIIYMNNFINNTQNVYSYDSTNIWNSTEKIKYTYKGSKFENYMGNYWDDYTGSDADEDGIGDTPYNIDSDKDNYPLMERFENYFAAENKPPIADFTYMPEYPIVDQTVEFDASSSYDPDGTIVSYDWDFGDGAKASGDVVTHAYSSAGNYTVILTVTDNEGEKNSTSKMISVITKEVIYVPDDYEKIQWAVDNASVGDTIIVRDGVYVENIDINKPHLTIKSENGSANCIVMADDLYDCVFEITADNVNISGFTIKGAEEDYAGIGLEGDYCIISENSIENNYCGIGLGKSNKNSILGNRIENNSLGIRLSCSNKNTISGNSIENNRVGIFIGYSHNNIFYLNNFNNTYRVSLLDPYSSNIWNSTEKITYTYKGSIFTNYLGNYWSDYTGYDADRDGIGDTAYSVCCTLDKDYRPLMEKFENYISPADSPPVVDTFSVTPSEITVGESFTISYSVSDDKGLERVELWRAKSEEDPGEGSDLWEKIKTQYISGTSYSGSFSDSPSTSGTYWYGIHVVDTAEQWKSERDYGKGPIKVGVLIDVPFFSQKDERWKDKYLDNSPYNFGKYGCAVTSAAMVLNYSGWDTDPLRLNMTLTAIRGINENGDITQKGWEYMRLKRVPEEGIGDEEELLKRVDEELAQERPVMASVNTTKYPLHYIVFRGKIGSEYHFWDPADKEPTDRVWPNGALGKYTLRTLRIYAIAPYAPPIAGKGIWIVNISKIEEKEGGLDNVINRLRNAKVSYVAIKCGDGRFFWSAERRANPERIKEFHDAGIKVLGWQVIYGEHGAGYYKTGGWPEEEADVSNKIMSIDGIDGFIIDFEPTKRGEYEYYVGSIENATKYLELIRKDHPKGNFFIAYAPYARVYKEHKPYYLNFSKYCDAVMPQAYWAMRPTDPETEIKRMEEGVEGESEGWGRVYDECTGERIPIIPIGQGIKLEKGNDVTEDDVRTFCEKLYEKGYLGVSLFRYYFEGKIIKDEVWEVYRDCFNSQLTIIAHSPVDIAVTDPAGFIINKEINEIPGATYTEFDINGDGHPDDRITILYRKAGDYLINVAPEPNASPTDTYTLEVSTETETIILAENAPVSEIPTKPYVFTSTAIFDTGAPSNPYPSISGTHNGTITPNKTIIATKLYTYACEGTGGHTEYARIWNETWSATASWKGYTEDWHNITFDKEVVLIANKTYNFTVITGSYPQIHHTNALLTENGWINCTEFIDANGNKYEDWIPAIKLWFSV